MVICCPELWPVSQYVKNPSTGDTQVADIFRRSEFMRLQYNREGLCTHFPVEIPCSARVLQSHVVDIKYPDYSAWAGSVLWPCWQLELSGCLGAAWPGSGTAASAWWHLCSAGYWGTSAPSDSYSTVGLSGPDVICRKTILHRKRRILRLFLASPDFRCYNFSKWIGHFIENSYLVTGMLRSFHVDLFISLAFYRPEFIIFFWY